MLTYFEERTRMICPGRGTAVFKKRSWRLFGVLIYRRYEQLTVPSGLATPDEKGGAA